MGTENKPSFAERISRSIDEKIEVGKYHNVCENGANLLENSNVFFGGDTEEKRLELMDRVFARYSKGDKSFQDIVDRSNNPNINKSVAVADKESFVNSVFIAINASVAGDDLVTDSMSAEDIDSYLPESCKGVGLEIKKISICKSDEEEIVKVNRLVSLLANTTVLAKDKMLGFEKIRKIIKDLPISSFVRQYTEVSLMSVASEVKSLEQQIAVSSRNGRGQQFRPMFDENGERVGGVEAAWQVTPEKLAEAMLFMDSSVRWQSYTPPEWFKQLDVETQARVEYMVMVCEGASYLSKVGKDMEKIRGNPMYFAFDNQKMTKLFNDDFKTAMSYMLQTLCEFSEPDKNGQVCLQYKEGLNTRGADGISAKVEGKLKSIRGFKEEISEVLAKKNGRTEPNWMDQMNAYTAWNLFYMFGDSSTADRRRKLPTYGGIICDGLRTLNPEYKAKSKWLKEDLTEAEWFGGPLGTYVQTVMQLERDLGKDEKIMVGGKSVIVHKDRPLDGNKTMKEKLKHKEIHILDTKTFYGFLDFVSGGEKGALYKNDGKDKSGKVVWKQYEDSEGKTLGGLLMDYAVFDDKGNILSITSADEWSFSDKVQVDFLNTYRDQMEAAAVVLDATTGKLETRDLRKYVSTIRTALGMVNGISINGISPYREYTKDPNLWANILLGSFGVDLDRLASGGGIYIMTTQNESYNSNLGLFITKGLELTNEDTNLMELMRLLAVDISNGEPFNGLKVTIRNEFKWKRSKNVTSALIRSVRRSK